MSMPGPQAGPRKQHCFKLEIWGGCKDEPGCVPERAFALQGNQSPEVLGVPLHQLCLTLRAALPERTPVASGLQGLLDPPPPASAARAMAGLSALGALGEGEALTMLGRHLVSMPMDPKMGKALIYGALLR